MANYSKSFNFRNGVQIDDDNFIVNSNGLVGIGTSVPTEILDVYGTVKVTGVVTSRQLNANSLYVSGISTLTNLLIGITSFRSGIITATSGIVTYYGDGRFLQGLPTSQWVDVNTGLGYSSIYAAGNVGVGTNYPYHSFQIGGNPINQSGVGINSIGDIKATGIITAGSFSGSGADITSISATNISTGTLNQSRLPSSFNVSGIITASSFVGNVTGNLTGVASTASSITSTSNIAVNSINSGFSTTGIGTVHTKLHIVGDAGIGTLNPNSDLHIRRSGISSIQLTSDGSYESTITFGRSVNIATNNAQIRFGNTNISYPSSTEQSLDIINYDSGNINFYLNPGGSGTGSYIWFKPSLGKLMTLTSSGNLGINSDSPSNALSVVGNAHISGAATVGGNFSVNGSLLPTNITVSGNSILNGSVGIATDSPFNTFQVGRNPIVSDGVGISSSGNIIASGIITAANLNVSGVSTAVNGFTSGIGITNPVKITVTGNVLTFTVTGVGVTSLTLY